MALNSQEIRNHYNDLYLHISNYIWPLDFIELLADLECTVYQQFQDIDSVKRCLDKIGKKLRTDIEDDEDTIKSLNRFESLLDDIDIDDVYVVLNNPVV